MRSAPRRPRIIRNWPVIEQLMRLTLSALSKRQPGLGLALGLSERLTAQEKVGDQVVATEDGERQIARLLRGGEGALQQRTSLR